MKNINQWLSEYGRDHKNVVNQKIHKVCVPLIMMSLLGIMWKIPTPEFMNETLYFNWATLFCLACSFFYLTLDKVYFLIMVFLSSLMLVIISILDQTQNLLAISIIIFMLSWMGQFVGHKIEGQKPSFLEDIQFLLIGPLWVFKGLRDKFK